MAQHKKFLTVRLAAVVICLPLCFGVVEAEAADLSGHELVADSLRVMGHKIDLRQVNRVRFDVKLVTRDIVENEHTGEPYPTSVSEAEVIEDFAAGDRVAESRSDAHHLVRDLLLGAAEQFEYFEDAKIVRTRATLARPGWQARNPLRALLLADKADDLRREQDVQLHESLQHVVSFSVGQVRVKLFLDAQTQFITAAEAFFGSSHATSSDIARNAVGDIRERTEFMLWDIGAGLRFPTQWDTYQNDVLLQTVVLTGTPVIDPKRDPSVSLSAGTNQQVDRLRSTDINHIPLNSAISGAPDPHRGIETIAPGVVQIPASWYTTLVEQEDGVVVIDAPISSGYSAQVIEEAARRFPGRPIKAVITSTAFFWHIAGVREYAARHIPIYVRDLNESTVRRILDSPHTLVPDRLSAHPAKAVIRAVSRPTQIGHGRNALMVMPIALAAEPMLMTYIADARLLHTGEMIQPLGPNGSLLYPESLIEIRDTVIREKLDAQQLIGMHMSPISWKDLEAAIADSGN